MSNGYPALRSSRVVLSEKSTIWSADSDPCSSDGRCRNTFPFTFALPDYTTGAGPNDQVTIPLPPSASIITRGASAHVFYSLKVDMFRKGVRFHDRCVRPLLGSPLEVLSFAFVRAASKRRFCICQGLCLVTSGRTSHYLVAKSLGVYATTNGAL